MVRLILLIPRASIDFQPESDTISSSQGTVQSTSHVEAIDSSPFKHKGPTHSQAVSPAAGQNPQSVTHGPLRNAPIAFANPMISIPPQ
jgi:hypothetical protein